MGNLLTVIVTLGVDKDSRYPPIGGQGLYRKIVILYPFQTGKLLCLTCFWEGRGSIQKNCTFVPPFYVENGGLAERFFCIDPLLEKKKGFSGNLASIVGIKCSFFCIDPSVGNRQD